MRTNRFSSFPFSTLALFFCVMLLTSSLHAGTTLPGLTSKPVLLERSAVKDAEKSELRTVEKDRFRVWVTFRDKGVFSQTDFNRVSSVSRVTDRSLARRAKAGIDEPQFLDLPVVESYVEQVQETGANIRRRSRWLNAVSVDATSEQLQAIRALSVVASVSSVVGYGGNRLVNETQESPRIESIVHGTALSYGSSFNQLDQLKVPVAHNLGLTGQGIFLALFDTGFRTGHEAFATCLSESRLIAQYDFVFNDGVVDNQPADNTTAWNHGSYIWSVSAGEKSGTIYGPAYKASMVLCKTEDVRSETPVEEDNWVAALEFVDSIGVDVVSSSLGYLDWYTYANFNGNSATITLAANTAAALGIVVCNSMGNEGPAAGTLTAPADAFDILSVGSVTSIGSVSSFSSRGPTFDGRIKPEVVARGSATYAASASGGTTTYSSPSGTSLSTPLVAGVACLLIEARPGFTPLQIRQALMESASNSLVPNNDIGWGIVNIEKALDWGLDLTASTNLGNAPLGVNFTATSPLSPTSYLWNFGDGGTSTLANPSHTYINGGVFAVTCTITSASGTLIDTVSTPITVQANQLVIATDSVYAGQTGQLALTLSTTAVLDELTVPLNFDTALSVVFQSMTPGVNAAAMDSAMFIVRDTTAGEYVLRFAAGAGSSLPVGTYPLADLTYKIHPFEYGNRQSELNVETVAGHTLIGNGPLGPSIPTVTSGMVRSLYTLRGNADNSPELSIDIGDLTYLVDMLFISFTPTVTIQSGDCDGDFSIDIGDLTRMVDFLFITGTPFPNP